MKFKPTDTNFFEETFFLFENDLASFEEDDEPMETDFLMRSSFEEIQDVLSMIFVDDSTFAQPGLIHGMISPVTVLPDVDVQNKFVDTWVVCVDRQFDSERFEKLFSGTMKKVPFEDLSYAIEDILTSRRYDETDVFILYGAEVNITYALDEEELSEKILSDCGKICEVAEKLLTEG